MTLYQAMVNRWVFPLIERHKAEGRAEGLAEGIERGIEQGRVAGERAVLERLLLRRFGSLSPEVAARVGAASPADVETWSEKVLDAETLEDVFNSSPYPSGRRILRRNGHTGLWRRGRVDGERAMPFRLAARAWDRRAYRRRRAPAPMLLGAPPSLRDTLVETTQFRNASTRTRSSRCWPSRSSSIPISTAKPSDSTPASGCSLGRSCLPSARRARPLLHSNVEAHSVSSEALQPGASGLPSSA